MNALAPLDLSRAQPAAHVPANAYAEMALLGCIMFDNAAFERVPDRFRAEHFYEPFNQRLYAAISDLIGKGRAAEPAILMSRFSTDLAFQELGGLSYLADMVEKAPPFTMAKDFADEVYDLAIKRELQRIGHHIVEASAADGPTLAMERVAEAEEMLFGLAEHDEGGKGLREFSGYVDEAVNLAAEAYGRDGGLSGLSTGLIDLDRLLGGLHPSDLVILAGRPSMGKSALAVNIAFDLAKRYAFEQQPDGSRKTTAGGRVAFYSLEMSGGQLATRILAEASGVPSDRIRKGAIQAHEFGLIRDAADLLRNIPLHIDETGAIPISKLAARARRMKRRHGLDLVVVDYLQLATAQSGNRDGNRVQEITTITTTLKALAKELNVPVLALSQLSRQVENREDKRPQLSDLRESGSIEQDADAVLFVYREAYYLGRAEPKEETAEHLAWQEELDKVAHVAEVIIGKQRHGPIGTVKLHFNSDLTKFGNLAREGRFDPRTKPIDFSEPRGGRDA